MLTNTQEFRRAALHFKKYGYYTAAPEKSKDWRAYWREEKRRCLEGYAVGDVRITGDHYYYLNYYQILRVKETENITGMRGMRVKEADFPAFWDGDYNYFWAVDIAQYGIDEQDYKKLNLHVNILDLNGGLNMVVLKGRGKGYSYKSGSMLAKRFVLERKYKAYAMAQLEEYLIKDGLLNKTWDGVDFIDNHTAWRQPRLLDRDMHKTTGYKKRTATGFKPAGSLNQIIGVTFNNDPEKARGKRGGLFFWEEAGKFPKLKTAWDIAEDSIRQGRFSTGCQIAFGTGSTEEQNFADLKLLFYEPDKNHVLPFENVWDEPGMSDKCSIFIPSYMNFEGFMDKDGNSDIEGAKQFIEGIRETKRSSGDVESINRYIVENPFNPQEAVMQSRHNQLPVRELQRQRNRVAANQLHVKMASFGTVAPDGKGHMKFYPSGDVTPIIKFPHSSKDKLEGCVTIYEPPIRDKDGRVPKDLYLACNDPYDHDKSITMESLGATYIVKKTSNISTTFHECIVASYVGRPDSLDDYNEQMFNLVEYYNAKLGFENDRGDVIPYARKNKLLDRLEEEFQMLYKKELSSSNVNRNFGMHMTPKRAQTAELYLRDWLKSVIYVTNDGKKMRVMDFIYDLALLDELINFTHAGNFDRVKALMVAMYHRKEVEHVVPSSQTESRHAEFFNRTLFA